MMTWLKTLFLPQLPSGPPRLLRAFHAEDLPLDPAVVAHAPGEWRIDARGAASFALHEFAGPPLARNFHALSFRAEVRCAGLTHCAFLELSCRFSGPARPSLLARGLHRPLVGERDWEFHEVTLHLPRRLQPDLIRLNIATEGPGSIWFRQVKLLEWHLPNR